MTSTGMFGAHQKHPTSLVGTYAMLALSVFGCGGSAANAPPPSNTPASTAPATAPVAAKPAAIATAPEAPSTSGAASAAAESKPAPEPKDVAVTSASSSTPSSEPSVPEQSATEVLTAPRVAFIIDYTNSEAKEKAEAKCGKEPKSDEPEVKSACMKKARNDFHADVLLFRKGKGDNATLTIYRRNDSALTEVLVAPVTFVNATPHSVQLKFKGGTGARPIWKTVASPTLNLPNDYTVEIDDAEYGKLRYDAKIGLVDK